MDRLKLYKNVSSAFVCHTHSMETHITFSPLYTQTCRATYTQEIVTYAYDIVVGQVLIHLR